MLLRRRAKSWLFTKQIYHDVPTVPGRKADWGNDWSWAIVILGLFLVGWSSSVHDGLLHSIFNSLLFAGLRCLWIVHSNLKNSLQFRMLPWPNFQPRIWPLLLLSEVCFGFACDLRVSLCTDTSNQPKGTIKDHLPQLGNWDRKSVTCLKAGLGYITKLRLKTQI